MLTPILVDTYYPKYLNSSKLEIIKYTDNSNSHSYFSSLSFSQYNINLSLIQSDLSENHIISILEKLLFLRLKNPIFLPFGASIISKKISKLLDLFNKNQVFCSFNNISDKKNFPSVHNNVTSIANIDCNNNFYFKKCDVDIFWFNKIQPIKVKTKKINYNSFILGDYYLSALQNIEINTKKEIIMPTWNFDTDYNFEVKKNELFGFKITDTKSTISHLPEGIFYDDGFIYGNTEQPIKFSVTIENETRDFTIDPVMEDNYQFSILAKKW